MDEIERVIVKEINKFTQMKDGKTEARFPLKMQHDGEENVRVTIAVQIKLLCQLSWKKQASG